MMCFNHNDVYKHTPGVIQTTLENVWLQSEKIDQQSMITFLSPPPQAAKSSKLHIFSYLVSL